MKHSPNWSKSLRGNRKPVLVEGIRSPFVKASGFFEDCDALELLSRVLDALLRRVPIDPSDIDECIVGSMVPQTKNPNIARDAILNLGLPRHIQGLTMNQACLSGLQAVIEGAKTISYGKPHFIFAGGVECLSDMPIVYSREARKFLVKLSKAKSAAAKLNIIKNFRAKAWLPSAPDFAEPLTGLTLGEHVELLAQEGQISRRDQDAWALASQRKAAAAQAKGLFEQEIAPIWPSPHYEPCILADNLIKQHLSESELAELKPIVDRRYGTLTSGNSAPLSDGSAVCLLADEERCLAYGFRPKLHIVDYEIVAVDPYKQLLVAPAIAVVRLLRRCNVQLQEIDRFEWHEGYAAQVLSCLRALESREFCEATFGLSEAFGAIPEEKLNIHGGAIALGHPYGTSGVRMLMGLANELERCQLSRGLLALGGAGGLAVALLVERTGTDG